MTIDDASCHRRKMPLSWRSKTLEIRRVGVDREILTLS